MLLPWFMLCHQNVHPEAKSFRSGNENPRSSSTILCWNDLRCKQMCAHWCRYTQMYKVDRYVHRDVQQSLSADSFCWTFACTQQTQSHSRSHKPFEHGHVGGLLRPWHAIRSCLRQLPAKQCSSGNQKVFFRYFSWALCQPPKKCSWTAIHHPPKISKVWPLGVSIHTGEAPSLHTPSAPLNGWWWLMRTHPSEHVWGLYGNDAVTKKRCKTTVVHQATWINQNSNLQSCWPTEGWMRLLASVKRSVVTWGSWKSAWSKNRVNPK